MKNIDFIQNGSQNAFKSLKKFIYIIGFVGIVLLANSCALGFVSTEPVYVESARPARPSNMHIWIDGDWVYNRQSHIYARNNGYWEMPSQNRTYVSGRWQSGPQGKYWEKGRWQRNSGHSNKNNQR
jgi:hypothetical protein